MHGKFGRGGEHRRRPMYIVPWLADSLHHSVCGIFMPLSPATRSGMPISGFCRSMLASACRKAKKKKHNLQKATNITQSDFPVFGNGGGVPFLTKIAGQFNVRAYQLMTADSSHGLHVWMNKCLSTNYTDRTAIALDATSKHSAFQQSEFILSAVSHYISNSQVMESQAKPKNMAISSAIRQVLGPSKPPWLSSHLIVSPIIICVMTVG